MYARPHIETHSRGKGQSAVAGAAYRLGMVMVDERTGLVHDYTAKGGVEWSAQICAIDAPEWQRDPAAFWNIAQAAEKHPRAQLARDFRIPVPLGFDQTHAQELAESVARTIAQELGAPVSVALHRDGEKDRFGVEKDEQGRGFHAHIYLPTRGVEPEGMAATKNGIFRDLGNSNRSGEIIERWNQLWATEATRLAQEQGLGQTFDHRSYERQGLDLTPEPKMGAAAVEMERRGVESRKGTEALAAKIEQAAQWEKIHAPEVAKQQERAREERRAAHQSTPEKAPAPTAERDPEEQAWRERWKGRAEQARAEADQRRQELDQVNNQVDRATVDFDQAKAAYSAAKRERKRAGEKREGAAQALAQHQKRLTVRLGFGKSKTNALAERLEQERTKERVARKVRDNAGEECAQARDTKFARVVEQQRREKVAAWAEAEAMKVQRHWEKIKDGRYTFEDHRQSLAYVHERAEQQSEAREAQERAQRLAQRQQAPTQATSQERTHRPRGPSLGR